MSDTVTVITGFEETEEFTLEDLNGNESISICLSGIRCGKSYAIVNENGNCANCADELGNISDEEKEANDHFEDRRIEGYYEED